MTKPWEVKKPIVGHQHTTNITTTTQLAELPPEAQTIVSPEEAEACARKAMLMRVRKQEQDLIGDPMTQCEKNCYLDPASGAATIATIEAQFESHPCTEVIAGHDHDYLNKIVEWNYITDQLTALKAKEMTLRKALADHYFPEPSEGTNTTELPDNWSLQGVFKYNRKVDTAALPAVLEKLPEGTEDRVIKYTPELKLREYNKLIKEHKDILEEAVIIKPGTPSLKLVPPKEPKE